MLLRSSVGILALAALAVSSSASVLSYRVTGTFNDAYGDYESLLGTTFTYDFSYDTAATNYGDEFTAGYLMNSAQLQTGLGTANGNGVAAIDLDPETGSMNFVGSSGDPSAPTLGYGLFLDDLKPQTGALPTDLVSLASTTAPFFYMADGYVGDNTFNGYSYAFADKVSIQAVPEPATVAALAVGTLGLLRRRKLR